MEVEHVTVYARSPQLKVTEKIVIKDFLKELELFAEGEKFCSKTFMLGKTPLRIDIYPNGRYWGDGGGELCMYLCNKSDEDVRVQFEAVADIFQPGIFTAVNLGADDGFPLGRDVSHEECIETYKDKKDFVLTVNVEIPGEGLMKMMGNEDAIAPKKYCAELCKNLHDKMMDTNFTLIFQGAEVPCHKNVLAAASPVFEAMVVNQHQEAIESKANIELSEEVGRAFVKYLYTGELDEDLLKEHAVAFLELGNQYIVQELKDLAEQEMLKQLNRRKSRSLLLCAVALKVEL